MEAGEFEVRESIFCWRLTREALFWASAERGSS